MHRENGLNRFDLYHQTPDNKQIQAKPDTEFNTFVADWQLNLSLYRNPQYPKLMNQALLINRFQQTGTKLSMNLERRPDYLMTKLIQRI